MPIICQVPRSWGCLVVPLVYEPAEAGHDCQLVGAGGDLEEGREELDESSQVSLLGVRAAGRPALAQALDDGSLELQRRLRRTILFFLINYGVPVLV